MVQRRRCPSCHEEKPSTEFYRNSGPSGVRTGGLATWCKTCVIPYMRGLRAAKRKEVLIHYSGDPPCCACCGITELEFLAIDHINGGGRKHLAQIGGCLAHWLQQENFPKGYRVLCHNCNFALGRHGYCPHKTQESRIQKDIDTFRKGKPAWTRRVVTDDQIRDIHKRFDGGERVVDIAKSMGLNWHTTRTIAKRIRWVHVV